MGHVPFSNLGLPSIPKDFTAAATGDISAVFTWTFTERSNLTFTIEYSTDNVNFSVLDATIPYTSNSYVTYSLSSLTTYYFRIKAVSANGSSLYSAVSSTTTFATLGPTDTSYTDGQTMLAGEAPWIAALFMSGVPTGITGVILDLYTIITSSSAVNGLNPSVMSWLAGGVLFDGSDATASAGTQAITQNVSYIPIPDGTDDIAIITLSNPGLPASGVISSMNYASTDETTYPVGTVFAQFGWIKYASGVASAVTTLTCSTSTRITPGTANSSGSPHLTTVDTGMIPVVPTSSDVYGSFGTGLIAADGLGGNYCVGVCNDFPSVGQPSMAVFTACFAQQSFIFGLYPYPGYP